MLMPSRVFSSVGVITRGRQRGRDTTVNAKRRKDWTAEWCGHAWVCWKSNFFGTSPLLITVLLLSTPNSSDWLLEEVRGRTWGNIWHIQLWLSHRGIAEQLEKGRPATWLMPGSVTAGQRPIFCSSCCHPGTYEQTHVRHHLALVHDQQTLPWHWGRWVLGTCFEPASAESSISNAGCFADIPKGHRVP